MTLGELMNYLYLIAVGSMIGGISLLITGIMNLIIFFQHMKQIRENNAKKKDFTSTYVYKAEHIN